MIPIPMTGILWVHMPGIGIGPIPIPIPIPGIGGKLHAMCQMQCVRFNV